MLVGTSLKKVGTIVGVCALSACSLEKEYPLPCVEGGKQAAKELCGQYRKRNLDEPGKSDVLRAYGFNERDARFIIGETSNGKSTCMTAVIKQCDLISLRNGVGY